MRNLPHPLSHPHSQPRRAPVPLPRREFLKQTALAAGLIALPSPPLASGQTPPSDAKGPPWYRRAFRWGQTNITEIDPERYDIAWWRGYWKRTHTQGVIINAGGIFAYYPSRFPLHQQPAALRGRDLYGELARAAHADGLAVLARMDSNRAHVALFEAHPDWFARTATGEPHRAGDLYITCINSPYYDEFIPDILREIIERTHPEGLTDNSWSGLGRASFCYCENCRRKFRAASGFDLPRAKNWNDAAYRAWIQWNYRRRVEVWELNNRVTQAAGGPDCLWIGMNSGSIAGQSSTFRDYKEICARAEIIMLDHQSRNDGGGFQHNADAGKLIHGLLGWEKLIPESMALYQAGRPTFRLASKPAAEARQWMWSGFAGGIQPWWHHVSAYHEDRRMYQTVEPVNRWHMANQSWLVNRKPVAPVALAWSQQNQDFYGRDHGDDLVELPYRGWMNALIRARIPYRPVHLDHLERDADQFSTLILPNLGAMSDAQCTAVRRLHEKGMHLVATGETSLFNEWGDPRPDFGLAKIFHAHTSSPPDGATADSPRRQWASDTAHSYLRLSPEWRARIDGPKTAGEPAPSGDRHPVLRGFDETDILPFGGVLPPLRLDAGTLVPLTFIPPFPVYPPETAWMRTPKTNLPGLILSTSASGSRTAFMPADIDRRFGRDPLPDHARLLENVVRWAAGGSIPLEVQGTGLVDCHLYTQGRSFILHLVNLTSDAAWRAPIHELIPIGPLRIRLRIPAESTSSSAQLLVSGQETALARNGAWIEFEVPRILDHELVAGTGES